MSRVTVCGCQATSCDSLGDQRLEAAPRSWHPLCEILDNTIATMTFPDCCAITDLHTNSWLSGIRGDVHKELQRGVEENESRVLSIVFFSLNLEPLHDEEQEEGEGVAEGNQRETGYREGCRVATVCERKWQKKSQSFYSRSSWLFLAGNCN